MFGASKQSLYLSNPPTGGGGNQLLAIGASTSPYISVYQRSGGTFTKVANPDVLPPGIVYGADWSPDGTMLACAHSSSPYLTIYKWTGTALEKMTDIQGGNPSGTSYNVRWNPAGTHLAVVHNGVPYASVYEFNGTSTFTKLTGSPNGSAFDITPSSIQYSCAWAPDGSELYTVGAYSSGVGVNGQSYTVSGSSFTYFRDITVGVVSYSIARDPNSNRLAIGYGATSPSGWIQQYTPNATIPKYDPGGSFISKTTNQTRGVEFSQTVDGRNLLAAVQYASPYIRLYDRVGDTYTQLANPDVLPPSNAFDVRFNRTSTSLAVAHQSGDLFTVYDLTNNSTAFVKASTSVDIPPAGTSYCVAWNH